MYYGLLLKLPNHILQQGTRVRFDLSVLKVEQTPPVIRQIVPPLPCYVPAVAEDSDEVDGHGQRHQPGGHLPLPARPQLTVPDTKRETEDRHRLA